MRPKRWRQAKGVSRNHLFFSLSYIHESDSIYVKKDHLCFKTIRASIFKRLVTFQWTTLNNCLERLLNTEVWPISLFRLPRLRCSMVANLTHIKKISRILGIVLQREVTFFLDSTNILGCNQMLVVSLVIKTANEGQRKPSLLASPLE